LKGVLIQILFYFNWPSCPDPASLVIQQESTKALIPFFDPDTEAPACCGRALLGAIFQVIVNLFLFCYTVLEKKEVPILYP